jgi:putative nucleotidyltransferase with HDIG domain
VKLITLELQNDNQYLDQIQSLGKRISSALDHERVLAELTSRICNLLGCEYGLIAFQDELVDRCFCYSLTRGGQVRLFDNYTVCLQLHPFKSWFGIGRELLDNDPPGVLRMSLEQYGVELSNYLCVPLTSDRRPLGLMAVLNKQSDFVQTDRFLVKSLSRIAAGVIGDKGRIQELKELFSRNVRLLAAAVEARDGYAAGHVSRVACYAAALARSLGWEQPRIEYAETGALLYDIGKIFVPDSILQFPGALRPEESALLKKHVRYGLEMVARIPQLQGAVNYVRSHHERFDGGGYPEALRAEEIPIEGRILAVADSFDAMLNSRPYRRALTVEEAAGELENGAGSQFDPWIVEIFLSHLHSGVFDHTIDIPNPV